MRKRNTNLRTVPKQCSEAEWRQRVDLAACYRLADIHGLGKIIWNHITARVPDEPNSILVFALGCRYDEVTASNLLKLDLAAPNSSSEDLNYTAYVIHGGVYQARPEVVSIMHTHTRAGLGVAALKEGLLPLCMEAMMFHDDLAYHDFEGISEDASESARLVRDLGSKNQMILRNHGLLTLGKSVGEAFWRMFQLNLACALQMDVLATGRETIVPTPEICRKVRQQYEDDFAPGKYEWPALLRHLDKVAPDYAT